MNQKSKLYRERAWIGVYTSDELIYACQLGYIILDTFELYLYKNQRAIFENYLKILAYHKLKVKLLS